MGTYRADRRWLYLESVSLWTGKAHRPVGREKMRKQQDAPNIWLTLEN